MPFAYQIVISFHQQYTIIIILSKVYYYTTPKKIKPS